MNLLDFAETAVERRFLEKVEVVEDCWQWRAYTSKDGYARFRRGRASDLAHRVSFEWFVGPIPKGLELDHLCRNRACVNPFHLEAVTARENNRRSFSPAGLNARKTHCVNGHEFNEENTARRPNGNRWCRVCQRQRKAERRRLLSDSRSIPSPAIAEHAVGPFLGPSPAACSTSAEQLVLGTA